MLTAIIAGERSPKALAEMARGVMRRKIARLEEALECSFFTPEHAFILAMMLGNIGHYTVQVEILDEKIAALCEPYERQIAQLDGIPGFGITAAQDLIAEIGTDMSAFPTAGSHLRECVTSLSWSCGFNSRRPLIFPAAQTIRESLDCPSPAFVQAYENAGGFQRLVHNSSQVAAD